MRSWGSNQPPFYFFRLRTSSIGLDVWRESTGCTDQVEKKLHTAKESNYCITRWPSQDKSRPNKKRCIR